MILPTPGLHLVACLNVTLKPENALQMYLKTFLKFPLAFNL